MAAKLFLWMRNKLKRRQFEDCSTQTEENKTDAFTQVEMKNSSENDTQTNEEKCDASTEIENTKFESKLTQTVTEIGCDKEVQTVLKKSENKETQVLPCLRLDKKTPTPMFPTSNQVITLSKKRARKPHIPLTTDFLKLLKRKYDSQGSYLKLEPENEEHGDQNVPCKLSLSPYHGGLEIQIPTTMSFAEAGTYGSLDLQPLVNDDITSTISPDQDKGEYAGGYIKLRETRVKQNKPLFQMKKFQKFVKLLKN